MKKGLFLEKYGPWAVIAGASTGLGEAYAYSLAKRGLNLILVARRQEPLKNLSDKLEKKYHIQARTISFDLSNIDNVRLMSIKTADLDIGLVVYNAALSLIGNFMDHPLEEHLKEIDINCKGPLSLIQIFGDRLLKRNKGGIILMSSLSSSQGSPMISNYAATKAWNLILAEGLWYEWKPLGVDIMACAAGATDTPNYRESGAGNKMKGMDPSVVSEKALKDLGKNPVSIPGFGNIMADFLMRHILPRKQAINIMGRTLNKIYGDKVK
jgi:uncharacterized protein